MTFEEIDAQLSWLRKVIVLGRSMQVSDYVPPIPAWVDALQSFGQQFSYPKLHDIRLFGNKLHRQNNAGAFCLSPDDEAYLRQCTAWMREAKAILQPAKPNDLFSPNPYGAEWVRELCDALETQPVPQ